MDNLDMLFLLALLADRCEQLSQAERSFLDMVHEEITEGLRRTPLPHEVVAQVRECCATAGIEWIAAWDGWTGVLEALPEGEGPGDDAP